MPSQEKKRADAPQRVSSRNKRAEILTVAADQFGQDGYEDTKWADVAAEVLATSITLASPDGAAPETNAKLTLATGPVEVWIRRREEG